LEAFPFLKGEVKKMEEKKVTPKENTSTASQSIEDKSILFPEARFFLI
jgi:hypothetical protein